MVNFQSFCLVLLLLSVNNTSINDHLNEYIMTSLRTVEGIDLEYVGVAFGEAERRRLESSARGWMERGVLFMDANRLHIPTSEFMLSDAVIESLFV